MTQSEQFLMEAFAGESQANFRYLAFAQQAEKEGYHHVASSHRDSPTLPRWGARDRPVPPKMVRAGQFF
jgi:hypothetical protein